MNSYVAIEGPAWLWILASFALLAAGLAFGALGVYVLRIRFALDKIDAYEEKAAVRVDVQRELGVVHERLAKREALEPLEPLEPIPVRINPPATIPAPVSIELDPDTDVHPCLPWHTPVRP
jgi:hypothetical protein